MSDGQSPQPAANAGALERALARLAESRDFAKPRLTPPVLEQARRLFLSEGGIEALYQHAPALDAAGLFAGTDWAFPQALVPGLVANTLNHGDRQMVMLEVINQLRLLAVARGDASHAGISAEQARHYLTQVLALNLERVFGGGASEEARVGGGDMHTALDRLFAYLVAHIGYEDILGNLVDEIWRILGQRPVQISHVKSMIAQIAVTLSSGTTELGDARLGSDRLISALFGPTHHCREDPGVAAYLERLGNLDSAGLQQEANGFSRAMHDTGLVSDYHAAFLRWLAPRGHSDLVPAALGLSTLGTDVYRCYTELTLQLIEEAIHPQTAQAVYGLAMLLERGILYMPSTAPALWRQVRMTLSVESEAIINRIFGTELPARIQLLAGVITVLGLPLGVGQGNNPTCQSARAISMWSYSDPDYLLHLVAQVARFDTVLMAFEGAPLNSADLPAGLVRNIPIDNDPVSTLLVPHLDRIYLEMGRRCADRAEDPHCWINPEFHGWWVGRDFAIAVDVATGYLKDYESFVRHFVARYHPYYNGNRAVIHPQPAGLAVTDSNGQFVGWHAITLMRVALDQNNVMRVYFYNPNNDSGQRWGDDVVVSTQGNGERFGESSLPFNQLASRLYIFHDDPLAEPRLADAPAEDVAEITAMATSTWAAGRLPISEETPLTG
jgi:hypothetical protein